MIFEKALVELKKGKTVKSKSKNIVLKGILGFISPKDFWCAKVVGGKYFHIMSHEYNSYGKVNDWEIVDV